MINPFKVIEFIVTPIKLGTKTFFFFSKDFIEIAIRVCNIYVLLTFLTAFGLLVISSCAATLAGYILGGIAIAIVEIIYIGREIVDKIEDALNFFGISVTNPIPRHTVFDELSILVEKNPFTQEEGGISIAFRILIFYISKHNLCKVLNFFRAIRLSKIFIYAPLSPIAKSICTLPQDINKYQIWFQGYPELALSIAYPFLLYLWIIMVTKPLWWDIFKHFFRILLRLIEKRTKLAKYLHEFVDRVKRIEKRNKKKITKHDKKNKYELLNMHT